jgi:hypothetical protein
VFFYIKQAVAALTIETEGVPRSPVRFDNVGAGLKYGPVPNEKRWTYLAITSSVAQVVEVIVSDDAEVDIASTVTVSGAVSVTEVPTTALSSPDDIAVAASASSDIAANGARRRITIGALSTNTDSLRVRTTAGTTNAGVELQPGIWVSLTTTSAIRVRNNSAASQSYFILEET